YMVPFISAGVRTRYIAKNRVLLNNAPEDAKEAFRFNRTTFLRRNGLLQTFVTAEWSNVFSIYVTRSTREMVELEPLKNPDIHTLVCTMPWQLYGLGSNFCTQFLNDALYSVTSGVIKTNSTSPKNINTSITIDPLGGEFSFDANDDQTTDQWVQLYFGKIRSEITSPVYKFDAIFDPTDISALGKTKRYGDGFDSFWEEPEFLMLAGSSPVNSPNIKFDPIAKHLAHVTTNLGPEGQLKDHYKAAEYVHSCPFFYYELGRFGLQACYYPIKDNAFETTIASRTACALAVSRWAINLDNGATTAQELFKDNAISGQVSLLNKLREHQGQYTGVINGVLGGTNPKFTNYQHYKNSEHMSGFNLAQNSPYYK